jgi:hypothetical protein
MAIKLGALGDKMRLAEESRLPRCARGAERRARRRVMKSSGKSKSGKKFSGWLSACAAVVIQANAYAARHLPLLSESRAQIKPFSSHFNKCLVCANPLASLLINPGASFLHSIRRELINRGERQTVYLSAEKQKL